MIKKTFNAIVSGEKTSIINMFFFLMLVGLVISFVAFLFTDGESFDNMLFYRWDVFMDYFNSTFHSTRDPYNLPFKSIYPALITAMYFVICSILEGIHGSFLTSLEIKSTFIGIVSYALLTALTLLILYKILNKGKEISYKETLLFYVLALTSFPMVWAIDRGNSILLSVVFSLLFIIGYDSESKKSRYLSYVFLGIATGIKIFPVFFGLLVLRKFTLSKQIEDLRETLVCAFIIAIVFLVPFILFEGSFFAMIGNAFGYRGELNPIGGVDVSSLLQTTAYLLGHENYLNLSTFGTIFSLALVLLIALYVLLDKDMEGWEQVFLIAAAQVLCTGIGHPYILLYMLIPAWCFINNNPKVNVKNVAFVISFALVLMLLPGHSTGYYLLSYSKGMILLMITIVILVLITIKQLRKNMLIKKCDQNKNSN